MRKASRDADYRKILVVRFSSMGDIVLTTPVLMALRKRFPSAQIDYLAKAQFLPLLENHPSGCGCIPLTDSLRGDSKAYLAFCDSLRDKGYDLIVDLQANGRSYVLRKRVFRDYVKVNKRTLRRILLVKFGLGRDNYPDIRRRFLEPLSLLGIDISKELSKAILSVDDCEIANVEKRFFSGTHCSPAPIAIHPGAKWELKEWGIEKFQKLAKVLIDKGHRVLWFGAPYDYESEKIIFAEKTSIRELMALIATSAVFVGNDSGPLHIAEGVGTPSVGIFGPTHPSLGYSPNHEGSYVLGVDIKCRPCSLFGNGKCKFDKKICMEQISVDEVADSVEKLFNEHRKNRAAFLDRDGTIIFDAHFLKDETKIELIPGAVEAIKALNASGYVVIVLTNQSGVARGYFGTDAVERINARVVELFAEQGAKISAMYYCPHLADGSVETFAIDCDCRKPKIGMAIKAAKEFDLDLCSSFVVGDKASDLQLAKNINAKAYLVRTGNGEETEKNSRHLADGVYDNILDAVKSIVGGS